MKNTWRRLSDRREVSVGEYIKSWMKDNPEHKVYIGCDSQNTGNKTVYATVIVLHYIDSGGAHVIYNKQTVPRIRTKKPDEDLFIRLWKEVEYSIETVSLLEEHGIGKPDYVDIDLNPDPIYRSNGILLQALGLVEAMGIKARWKTKSPWAISIADAICKPKKKRNRKRSKRR